MLVFKYIAAVHLEGVVLDAAAIDAELRASRDANFGLVLAGLVTHARSHGDKLREVAAVQPVPRDFLLPYRCRHRSRIRLDGNRRGCANNFDLGLFAFDGHAGIESYSLPRRERDDCARSTTESIRIHKDLVATRG